MKKIIKEDEFQEMQPSSEPLNRSLARYKNIPVILLVVWSTVMVPLFMPNMGGTGLALPQNIVAWIMIVIIIGMTMAMLPGRHQLLVTSSWRYAALAVAILALPLCFTHAEWLEHAEWRQLGLTGGLIFWLALLQWRWSTRQRQWVMYGLLFSVALQALAVLCQLSGLPVAHRIPYPYQLGVFQQRNLLASFWAVGLGLALGMFLSPAYRWRRYEHVRQAGLLSLLWLLSALLTLQQSRTGWLSAGVIVIWGILLFARRHPARAALAFGFITAGILLAIYLIYAGHTVSYQSHLHSNLARISMYRDALRMIGLKPWTGWGYGGFEYTFQHFRINQTPPTEITEIARYPHNELLYWLVEGGAIAAAGLLVLGYAAWQLGYQLWRQRTPGAEKLPLCLAIFPLLLHSLTEYPFYLSITHWAIFLVLLAMLQPACSLVNPVSRLSVISSRLITTLLPISTPGITGVLLLALYGQWALTRFEQHGLADPDRVAKVMRYAPLVNRERWEYDWHTACLLRFNLTHDIQLLRNYTLWAEGYLSARVDQNVYANLITIYRFLGRPSLAEKQRKVAEQLFPQDVRFRIPEQFLTHPGEAVTS